MMVTVGEARVHPNGARPGVTVPASLIGKTLATARPAARRAALGRGVSRAWRAFRPAALATAAYSCATSAAYVAAGLWPALASAAVGLLLLEWQAKAGRPPVIVDEPDPPAGGAG